jgi:hypothetical protein
LTSAVLPSITGGAAPIVNFLGASQRYQRKGGKSNCDLVQINHGVSFSGSKAAMLRANKTYA